jgi:glucose/arabinose dehydrogenase
MNRFRLGLRLLCIALAPAAALAAQGPPGMSQPLGAGPFTYRTGEGQNIRVTVLARLTSPYAIAFLPDGDLLVTQRTGALKRIAKGSGAVTDVPGGPKSLGPVVTAGVHGYMAIALHPRFAENGYVYIAYTRPPEGQPAAQATQEQPQRSRTVAIARARYADGRLHDTKDVWVGEGVGGPTTVALTPDAKLWIGTTEGGRAQDTTFLGGKVLRLNDDGSVPADNPFAGKEGWRPEIYSLGHRTALGLYVHPVTGQLWEAEMGPNGGDEINLIRPGLNYGWPVVSLGRSYPGPWQAKSNEPAHSGYELPLRSTPIVCRPKTMMMAPARRLKSACRSLRNWPTALAAAPRDTNTSEKPRMNASDDQTTWRRAAAAGATATPTPAPPAATAVPRISSSERPEM